MNTTVWYSSSDVIAAVKRDAELRGLKIINAHWSSGSGSVRVEVETAVSGGPAALAGG